VTLTRLTVPDPVAVDLGKSIPPLKPLPAIASPLAAPAAVRRTVAAESTPGPVVTLTRLTVPDPVAVDLGKSIPPLKPLPAIASPCASPLAAPAAVRRTVAAESTPPRRATGRLPEAARSAPPKRTFDELLVEARSAAAGWPDAKVTGEGIRRELRTSPANARKLRDTLLAERRAGVTVPTP
ncbi:hypothetical protein ACIRBW_32425, partial [Streptomyces sp. NPDC094437]